jgi:hypothetical protein
MVFPFKALCSAKRAASPLKVGDALEVVGIADADDCANDLATGLATVRNGSKGSQVRAISVTSVTLEILKPYEKASKLSGNRVFIGNSDGQEGWLSG